MDSPMTYDDFDQFFNLEEAAVPNQDLPPAITSSEGGTSNEQSSLAQSSEESVDKAPIIKMSLGLTNDSTSAPEMIYMDPDAPQDLERLERLDRGTSAVPEDIETSDPSTFIPRYYKPHEPCEFCAVRQLECKVFLVDGNRACLSCNALFRPCSFVDGHRTHAINLAFGNISTLHVVEEDTECALGQTRASKSMYSTGAALNEDPSETLSPDGRQEKCCRRFSRSVLHILKRWLDEHSEKPYPTEEEKQQLKDQTGLTRSQISNWL